MKKNNMLGVWLTTISISTVMASAATAFGQQAPAAALPHVSLNAVRLESFAPRQGEWKVENGLVLVMEPGKNWTPVGDGEANLANAIKALTMIYADASFALDPRLAKAKVGDLLDRVDDPLSELKALRVATSGAFDLETSGKLLTLEPTADGGGHAAWQNERTVECFNLQGYLYHILPELDEKHNRNTNAPGPANLLGGGAEAAAIDKAIGRLRDVIRQAIQSVDPSLGQPDFQYFAEGQMLIATGPHQSLIIAGKVIQALPGMDRVAGSSDWQRQPAGGGGGAMNGISPLERLFRQGGAPPEQSNPGASRNYNADPAKSQN